MSETRTEFRERIWQRDKGRCHLCGEPVALQVMHLDHVIPRALGGEDHERNLRVAHRACNLSKGDRLGAFRPQRRSTVRDAAIRSVLKMPRALHDKLKTLAERERRSLHSQIIYLLEKAIEGEK